MSAPVAAIAAPRRARLSPANLVLHVLDLLPMILVHAGVVAIFFIESHWQDWVLLPVFMYFRGLITTIGYHRYFSHRSFKTFRIVQFLIGVACCTNVQQGPLWWAAYHRRHHRYSDTPGDPHSPHEGGFLWAYCGWLFIPLDPEWNSVGDLRRHRELVWLQRFWQVPGLLMAGLCFWLGGWSSLCVAFCLSAVVIFHMTFLVNTSAHLFGSRRYPTLDKSRNSFWLALVTQGDGWHNNHHHYPHAAQAGFFRGEIDGAFRMIRLLEWLGIIWNVRRVPAHKLNPPQLEDAANVEAQPVLVGVPDSVVGHMAGLEDSNSPTAI